MNIDYMFILYLFLISLGINMVFFIIAFKLKTDVFTDITYALTFIICATVMLSIYQQFSWLQISVYILVILWAIRLGFYLFKRILKTRVDHRFDRLRNSFFKFMGFWILQAITVFLIMLPIGFVIAVNQKYIDVKNYYTIVFLAIALLGLIFETIADLQKSKFYSKENREPFIKSGLWKISRHPNYFGEIVFWLFICLGLLFNIIYKNIDGDLSILVHLLWLMSPIYIALLLLFVSGVPLLEVNTYKKLKDNKEYEIYMNKTSCVLPFFGKKGNIKRVKKLLKGN